MGRAAQALRISADLSLLAQALRDTALQLRSVARYSLQPDPQQKQERVQRYLQWGLTAEALPWLRADQGNEVDHMRQRLLVKVLEQLGRLDDGDPMRRGLFYTLNRPEASAVTERCQAYPNIEIHRCCRASASG